VTAQLLWDGTFSTEAVATAGLARLDQLHAEALANIAALAENWDRPAGTDQPAAVDQPVDDAGSPTFSDPESWSAEDDELLEDDEPLQDDDEAPVLVLGALPPLPPMLRRPRVAANVTAAVEAEAEDVHQLASA